MKSVGCITSQLSPIRCSRPRPSECIRSSHDPQGPNDTIVHARKPTFQTPMHAEREPAAGDEQFIPPSLVRWDPDLFRVGGLTLPDAIVTFLIMFGFDLWRLTPLPLENRLTSQFGEVAADAGEPGTAAPEPPLGAAASSFKPSLGKNAVISQVGDILEALVEDVGEALGQGNASEPGIMVCGRWRVEKGSEPGVEGEEGSEA